MSRNEPQNVVDHVGASMAPVMGQAMANPLGVISAFVLFALVGVAIWVVKALGETVDSWGPLAVLAVMLAGLYAGHRWLWGTRVTGKTARRITVSVLLVGLVLTEAFLGLIGLAVGKVIGYNPRAAMMDAGYEVPDAVRAVITNERQRIARRDKCRAALADGTMLAGKATSVNWAMNCAGIVPPEAQKRACVALEGAKGNAVSLVNARFCQSIGVYLTHRRGANPG